MIIGASKGYAVNEGWIEGFTPEERTLTNGKQSLTLGKDTWIILTASDAVGNIAMGSSYKTGALSSQPLIRIDFSDVNVDGKKFFSPLLLTGAGAQYNFTSGEVTLVNPNISTQVVDSSSNIKAPVSGTKAVGGTAATLNGQGDAGLAVAGENGMHIGLDLLSGGMNLGQGLSYDVNTYRNNVFFTGNLTLSGNDTNKNNHSLCRERRDNQSQRKCKR